MKVSRKLRISQLNILFSIFILRTKKYNKLNKINQASLLVQWLRIHLAMQGTQVPSLVQEDPTCVGQLSLSTITTEPESCNYGAHMPQLLKPVHLRPCSAT